MFESAKESLQGQIAETLMPAVDLSWVKPMLTTILWVTILLTVLFVAYAIYNLIRNYQVTQATLEMQKDIRRMRELMEQGSTPTAAPTKELLSSVDEALDDAAADGKI